MKLWGTFADTQEFQDLPGAFWNKAAVDMKNVDVKFGQPYLKLDEFSILSNIRILIRPITHGHVHGEANED